MSSLLKYEGQIPACYVHTRAPVKDAHTDNLTALPRSQMLLSHLLSCNIHVPYDDAAIAAAGDELTGVRGVAQTLNFITVIKQKPRHIQSYHAFKTTFMIK